MELSFLKKIGGFLVAPVMRLSVGQSLVAGVATLAVAAGLGFFANCHFDGVLDVHIGAPAPFVVYLVEQGVNWAALTLFLLLGARHVGDGKKESWLLVGTQAVARLPNIIAAVVALTPSAQVYSSEMMALLAKMAAGGKPPAGSFPGMPWWMVPIFLSVVWFVVLSYRSFSRSSGAKGWAGYVVFGVAVIGSEVCSKMVLSIVYRLAG